MKLKVTEYINRNGPFRWQISTSVKVTLENVSLALAVFHKFTSKFRHLENVGHSHDVQLRIGAIR